jgi:hypothetical protein
MRKLRIALFSFAIGLVLSIPTVAVLGACDATLVFEGQTCTLAGQSCSQRVCVCAYICGP